MSAEMKSLGPSSLFRLQGRGLLEGLMELREPGPGRKPDRGTNPVWGMPALLLRANHVFLRRGGRVG